MSRARHGKVQDQRRSKTRKVGPRALDRGKRTQELLTLVTRTVPLDSLAQESTGVPAGLARRALSSILAHAVHEGRTILLLAASRDHWDRLSVREREVVRLCVQGHSSKEIGTALQLQACTVSSKMRLIYANLGVQSKAALIRLAFPHVEHELAMAEAGTTSAPS